MLESKIKPLSAENRQNVHKAAHRLGVNMRYARYLVAMGLGARSKEDIERVAGYTLLSQPSQVFDVLMDKLWVSKHTLNKVTYYLLTDHGREVAVNLSKGGEHD